MESHKIEISGPVASGKGTTTSLITRVLREHGYDVSFPELSETPEGIKSTLIVTHPEGLAKGIYLNG